MAPRGRGGKFSKPTRGGGKHFSRDILPVDKDGNPVSLWREQDDDDHTSTEEEEEDASSNLEEESEDEASAGASTSKPSASQQELTREERRALAKAKKAVAAARRKNAAAQPGDLPPSDSEPDSTHANGAEDSDSDLDLPTNPNHTFRSQSQLKAASGNAGDEEKGEAQLSRREREAIEAQQAKERYMKLHAEGKTEEARADLARLALVKERREAERLRKEAEKEEKAEIARKKAEERERKLAGKGAAAGKKKGKK